MLLNFSFPSYQLSGLALNGGHKFKCLQETRHLNTCGPKLPCGDLGPALLEMTNV